MQQIRRTNPRRRALASAGVLGALAALVAAFAALGYAQPSAQQQYGPTNTAPPTITGEPREGTALTAQPGSWSSTSNVAYSYAWQRCNPAGQSCAAIAGATAQTYTPVAADVGNRLRVIVTATNASGSSEANSGVTERVLARNDQNLPEGAIRLPNGQTSIPVTSVALPARLVIDRVEFSPSPVRSRNPITLRVHVVDTRNYVVRDALVYPIGVPYSRIVQPTEVRTNTDGWATIQLVPTRNLTLRNGYYLTVFVRARKPNENLLGGVSTRRLIQVRTANPS